MKEKSKQEIFLSKKNNNFSERLELKFAAIKSH